ncbi:MAG: alanine--tRNA ligase-related protein, partial [Thermoproteota archaeon]
MTELLYMDDSYLKEFEARIVEVIGNNVVLDRTAFHPKVGGLPDDTGVLVKEGEEFRVLEVFEEDGKVLHKVPGHSLMVGDTVRGILDWDKRYMIMRMHT